MKFSAVRKLFFVVSFVVITFDGLDCAKYDRTKRETDHDGVIVGGDPCTWGPSYWCASVDNANECGFTVSTIMKCSFWPYLSKWHFFKGIWLCAIWWNSRNSSFFVLISTSMTTSTSSIWLALKYKKLENSDLNYFEILLLCSSFRIMKGKPDYY